MTTAPFRDAHGVWHPRDEAEVQWLVAHARSLGRGLRARGAGHSAAAAIGCAPAPAGDVAPGPLKLRLDRMRALRFDDDTMQVTAQAGCNIGVDFREPTGRSTPENSLIAQLDARGWALPNLGGIAHQTVAGMLMTGSSGGSVQHDLGNSVVGLRLVDGTGTIRQLSPADGDLFDAAGVSMGLLGIVVEVTLQCEARFDIMGDLTASPFDDAPFDVVGQGPGSLEDYLRETPYARIEWWPQRGIDRMVLWQARRMTAADYTAETGSPGQLRRQRFLPFAETGSTSVPVQTAGGVFLSFFAWWNPVEKRLGGGNRSKQAFRRVMGGLYEGFVHSPDAPPVPFRDTWFQGLPMDDPLDDRALPMSFGEVWLPLEHTGEAMRRLRAEYHSGGADAHNLMACEIYAAGPSRFSMAQGHGRESVRLNWYWYDRQGESVTDWMERKYRLFEDLEPRLHWGKILPSDPTWVGRVVRPTLPGWSAFEDARRTLDPDDVFLTPYWAAHLGIRHGEPLPQVSAPPRGIDFLPPSPDRRPLVFRCTRDPQDAATVTGSKRHILPLDVETVEALAADVGQVERWWPGLTRVELLSGGALADDTVALLVREDHHAARLHLSRSTRGWTARADATSHPNVTALTVGVRWEAVDWGVAVTLEIGISLRVGGPPEAILEAAVTRHLSRALEGFERTLHTTPVTSSPSEEQGVAGSPRSGAPPSDGSSMRTLLRGSRDATPLLDKYTDERPFALSTGREIMMPERVARASSLGLLGTMNRAAVDAIAAPFGLSAVPLTPGTCIGGVFVIDYEEATFGTYQEALFMVAVRPGPPRRRSALKLPGVMLDLASTYMPAISRGGSRQGGFLLWKLYVNQPEVAVMAREVWQADIEERHIEVHREGDARAVLVQGADGKAILDASWSASPSSRHPLEMDMMTYMTRPAPPRPSQTLIRGDGQTGLFRGEVRIDSDDPFAQALRGVDWTPKVWQHFSDFEAVFFEDLA